MWAVLHVDDAAQQRMQFLVSGCVCLDKAGRTIGAAALHPVQHQTVQVNVQVRSRAKALDQCDRAALAFVNPGPRVAQQIPLDHALHHLQHRRDQLGLRGQQHAQRACGSEIIPAGGLYDIEISKEKAVS